MKEVLSDIFKVNLPNLLTVAVINISTIQQWATLALTLMSLAATAVLLWRRLRNDDKE